MRNKEDDNYILDAINGNQLALEYLLSKYRDIAFSIAYKYVENAFDAEDIIQEAFIKVFLNIRKFRNQAAFSTWLYKIIYTESIIFLSKKEKNSFINEIDQAQLQYEEESLNDSQEIEIKEKVKGAMSILTKNEYFIVTLFYLLGKNINEIANINNQSNANIKVLLHRARKKMLQYFEINHID